MVDGIKWIELLIKGIVVGYIASIPLGPIGVICIQRTLSKEELKKKYDLISLLSKIVVSKKLCY